MICDRSLAVRAHGHRLLLCGTRIRVLLPLHLLSCLLQSPVCCPIRGPLHSHLTWEIPLGKKGRQCAKERDQSLWMQRRQRQHGKGKAQSEQKQCQQQYYQHQLLSQLQPSGALVCHTVSSVLPLQIQCLVSPSRLCRYSRNG